MGLQIFDDGSTMTTDGNGNILSVTDYNGAPVQVSSDIFGQLQVTLLSGVNQAVQRFFNLGGAANPGGVTRTQAQVSGSDQLSRLLAMGAMVGGAFLLFKHLAK